MDEDYRVLVPTDFSNQSNYALHQALHIAQRVEGVVVMLFVLQQKKGILGNIINKEQQEKYSVMVQDKLREQAEEISQKHNITVEYQLKHATSVHSSIVEYANEIKASIIVMGKGALIVDGKEMPSIGSITSKVLRTAKIPVVTVSNKYHNKGCSNILLPLDLSKETRQKVSWGIQFARLFNSNIQLVSALFSNNDFEVRQTAAQMKQVVSFIKKQGVNVEGEIIRPKGNEKTFIDVLKSYMQNHKEIDLAIIMTQQEDDFTHLFMGSSANAFIKESKIPVMSIVPRQLDNIIIGM